MQQVLGPISVIFSTIDLSKARKLTTYTYRRLSHGRKLKTVLRVCCIQNTHLTHATYKRGIDEIVSESFVSQEFRDTRLWNKVFF